MKGVTRLREENNELHQQIQQLKADLEQMHNSEDVDIQPKRGKRATITAEKLKAEVQRLKDEIAQLRSVCFTLNAFKMRLNWCTGAA